MVLWGPPPDRREPPLDLSADQLGDARPVRNKTALPELAASHHQQVAVTINIAQAQPTDLTSAQAQSVAKTKDDAIRRTALSGSRVIRKCSRRSQQAASLDDVENERRAAGGDSTSPDLER
jgi:multidrug resistance efflux pump